jgi:hypothetical protein
MLVNTNNFSHTCHGFLGVGGGWPAWAGVSSNDWHPLLKWEYHSSVFDWLRQDSRKAACSISYVSAPVFCGRKQIKAHRLLHFPFHCEMRRILQVDVHWKTSTERMRGDTDLRFCAYTCTELICFALCCHFATYYSFQGEKISLGIKWSAHVLFRIEMFMDLFSDCWWGMASLLQMEQCIIKMYVRYNKHDCNMFHFNSFIAILTSE